MTAAEFDGRDPLHATIQSTGRFVWANLVSVVLISVGWFFASLPVVTVGPATVGAYRAVLSLREDDGDGIDGDAVWTTVREQFVHATLIGLVPLAILAIAATYGVTYLTTGTLVSGLLALVGVYTAAYICLVWVPTFVGLAEGETVADAVTAGYRWTARHAVGAVALAVVTVVLFVVSSLLTVALALLFAGVAFAFHVEFVTAVSEIDRLDGQTVET
ncbi:DUF624 domain-containing protein [Halopelagius longus]|uniref:DUF624 domain-containing protein n=1 Tax=Halopelagius longus TaxID=1236180 RepID=A0A1H1FMF1_9EURY|nr:DUF624 domain-containing protein [Halopelagius longus]RDI70029.1 DUF624 domain-containing protein [Halopelagius longus]SDR02081.1 Protein of unknown function, DUF624 [Halopelagius longus]